MIFDYITADLWDKLFLVIEDFTGNGYPLIRVITSIKTGKRYGIINAGINQLAPFDKTGEETDMFLVDGEYSMDMIREFCENNQIQVLTDTEIETMDLYMDVKWKITFTDIIGVRYYKADTDIIKTIKRLCPGFKRLRLGEEEQSQESKDLADDPLTLLLIPSFEELFKRFKMMIQSQIPEGCVSIIKLKNLENAHARFNEVLNTLEIVVIQINALGIDIRILLVDWIYATGGALARSVRVITFGGIPRNYFSLNGRKFRFKLVLKNTDCLREKKLTSITQLIPDLEYWDGNQYVLYKDDSKFFKYIDAPDE
jgi:hypothetical protein